MFGRGRVKTPKGVLDKADFDQKKQIAWLERLVRELLMEQRGCVLMPPVELRTRVGARESAANFWNQGRNSSARVLEVFGAEPDGPVLDWGCGSGRTLYWLYAHEAWRQWYRGCDVDSRAISWLKGQGVKNVAVCGDLPPLPYGEGKLAGLFCFSVLTHIHPDRHRSWFEEIHRVLRPGARAYVTFNGPSRMDEERFQGALRRTFADKGWLYIEQPGHYMSAAIVSREHTLKALEGLFAIEQHRERGYNDMDDLILRKA